MEVMMEIFQRSKPHFVMLDCIKDMCNSLPTIKETRNKQALNDITKKILFTLNTLKRFDLDEYVCHEIAEKLEETQFIFAMNKGFKKIEKAINNAILFFQHSRVILVIKDVGSHKQVYCSGKKVSHEKAIVGPRIKDEDVKKYESWTECEVAWYEVRIGDVIITKNDELKDIGVFPQQKKLISVLKINIRGIFELQADLPTNFKDIGDGYEEWEKQARKLCDIHMLDRVFLSEFGSQF